MGRYAPCPSPPTPSHDDAYNRDQDQKPGSPRMAQEPSGRRGLGPLAQDRHRSGQRRAPPRRRPRPEPGQDRPDRRREGPARPEGRLLADLDPAAAGDRLRHRAGDFLHADVAQARDRGLEVLGDAAEVDPRRCRRPRPAIRLARPSSTRIWPTPETWRVQRAAERADGDAARARTAARPCRRGTATARRLPAPEMCRSRLPAVPIFTLPAPDWCSSASPATSAMVQVAAARVLEAPGWPSGRSFRPPRRWRPASTALRRVDHHLGHVAVGDPAHAAHVDRARSRPCRCSRGSRRSQVAVDDRCGRRTRSTVSGSSGWALDDLDLDVGAVLRDHRDARHGVADSPRRRPAPRPRPERGGRRRRTI